MAKWCWNHRIPVTRVSNGMVIGGCADLILTLVSGAPLTEPPMYTAGETLVKMPVVTAMATTGVWTWCYHATC